MAYILTVTVTFDSSMLSTTFKETSTDAREVGVPPVLKTSKILSYTFKNYIE